MKTAYELAMERLEKESPNRKITDDQRRRLSEVDDYYQAKIAERRILVEKEIATLAQAGKLEEMQKAKDALTSDIQKLEKEREEKKDKIRNESE